MNDANTRMVPKGRPGRSGEWAERLVRQAGVTQPVWLLGCRGYYQDTMGLPGMNDVGIYDDAIFVGGPLGCRGFNANTDPAKLGMNPKVGKPMAMLSEGTWLYQMGMHKGRYAALVQARPVIVRRGPALEEEGWFGINIHKGGTTATGSEGCQTIVPAQWSEFIELVQRQMKAADRRTINYVLVEVQG